MAYLRDGDGDDSSEKETRLRNSNEIVITPQAPRTSRDRLFALLSDRRFHSAHEMANLERFEFGEWFVALSDISKMGFDFIRLSNSLRVIRRSIVDKPQDLFDLLQNIDALTPEDVNPRAAHQNAKDKIAYEQGIRSEPPASIEPAAKKDWETNNPESFDASADTVASPPILDRLNISVDGSCFLPAKSSVTATRAILAMKGSGKTYLAMVIAEEFLKFPTKLPFVVLDPTGVWWGLCSLANGTASPWSVLVLGGTHGSLPLRPEDGKLAADLVTEIWPHPIVFDLSELLPEDQHLFAADFGAAIYAINKRPLNLIFEESDEFAPQIVDNTYKHQRRCFHVVDRIVRRGRNRGLGVVLITQRPAVIHKNVLSQVDGIVLLNMAAPHDLEAVDSWMKPVVSGSERGLCLQALPNLIQGEAFFLQKGSKKTPLMRFMVRPKETYDSSRTPDIDEPEPPTPAISRPGQEIVDVASRILGRPNVELSSGET